MIQDFIRNLIPILRGEFLINALLRSYTTFQIGGPADIIIFPRDIEDLEKVMNLVYRTKLPFLILGNGSNFLVKDSGYKGIIICLKRYFNSININGHNIDADGGVLLSVLSRKAQEAGLSGLEFAVSIPATLGGAIHNNASAFGQSIGDVVEQLEFVENKGNLKKINRKELIFTYRKCTLPYSGVIVKAKLNLKREAPSSILKKMEKNVENRNKLQPVGFPSAGSIFKNPEGDFAGRIIEEVGLKGMVFGKAKVSEKHANFIVNTGGATADDVLHLIELIENKVYEKTGIKLEKEIEVIG
ncbi:MAG: UDP-N-acetylmuramate dehydrogenase [Candidatus Firestonebacteria bacterium]|nr:UDP-N-acetylmuramate dehydrogenase [Candidatus Firestonebacteria bacterium]